MCIRKVLLKLENQLEELSVLFLFFIYDFVGFMYLESSRIDSRVVNYHVFVLISSMLYNISQLSLNFGRNVH